MIPAKFNYHRAKSVDEAISMLQEHGDMAKLLAGGHSLVPAMKLRLNMPEILIDISRIDTLRSISEHGHEIAIGSMVTHHEIARSAPLQKKIPMMCEAAELIGDVQVRNAGTLGGSIAHADPAADWPAVLLALDAKISVKGPGGERIIAAEDFFSGFYMTALEPGELITAVHIPVPPSGSRMSYQKFMQPASRFAIVGCAAVVSGNGTSDHVRIAFTGVSEAPFRDKGVEAALKGKPANAEHIAKASEKAAEGVSIMGDHFASESYRRHLARVFAKRALMAAVS